MKIKIYTAQYKCRYEATNVKHFSVSTSCLGFRRIVITFNDDTSHIEKIFPQEVFGIWLQD